VRLCAEAVTPYPAITQELGLSARPMRKVTRGMKNQAWSLWIHTIGGLLFQGIGDFCTITAVIRRDSFQSSDERLLPASFHPSISVPSMPLCRVDATRSRPEHFRSTGAASLDSPRSDNIRIVATVQVVACSPVVVAPV